jgi:hypothetical protein
MFLALPFIHVYTVLYPTRISDLSLEQTLLASILPEDVLDVVNVFISEWMK